MTKLTITERGWSGHFIAAQHCLFRRNTLVEGGDARIVVSTIGNYRPALDQGAMTRIGINRYYETMAFIAYFDSPYWEANIEEQVRFESEWSIESCEEVSDLLANDMHDRVVEEFKRRLQSGETFNLQGTSV